VTTPGQRKDKPLSNMAMEMMLRRMKQSSRSMRCAHSSSPREVTETALAHVIGDKAEQAYRRSDALEKRRKLMEAWAAYGEPKGSDNVVRIRKR
jgi:hypothetical protein